MKQPRKILLIVNPVSGTRSKKGIEDMLARALTGTGDSLETALTTGPHSAEEFAAQAAALDYDIVAVAGGDGTVARTASALINTTTSLAIIPFGSGNGLARTLSIPSEPAKAIEVIARGHSMRIDHGTVNHIPFFCTFGLGFDAAVTEKFATSRRRGRLSYVRNVFLEYLNYSPQAYALEVEGRVLTRNAFLVTVCNTSQYGNNAYIAPGASITDGLLDITLVHSGSPLETAIAGVGLLTGHLDRNTLVETIRVPSAVISRLNDDPAQVDGEPIELGRRLEVRCHPASLRVVCPEHQPEFRPIVSPIRAAVSDLRSDILYFLRRE